MTNSTSTDVTFGGGWCNRVVTKQEDYQSTTPANNYYYYSLKKQFVSLRIQ